MTIVYKVTVSITRTDDLPFDETDPHYLSVSGNRKGHWD
jgi:hypothetical protein